MLRDTTSGLPSQHFVASPAEATERSATRSSDEETLLSTSGADDQTIEVGIQDAKAKSLTNASLDTKKASSSPPPQTKVLFLDGLRGIAAMLVVVQHSEGFYKDLHFGSFAVDIFFVLSSFLLTWIFMKKSMKLLAQGASLRTWGFMLADYFQKRFFRVYPLFAVTVVVLTLLSTEDKRHYFIVSNPEDYDIFKTLTFEYDHRYHVLWTLPLEIAYYFVIPAFVLLVLGVRRFWWLGAVPLFLWTVSQGIYVYRASHMPLQPHLSTFMTGSLAAVVFVKLDMWMKKTDLQFRWWHTLLLRVAEGLAIAMTLSVCFRGILFDWVAANPAPPPKGFPYTSAFLGVIIIVEMIRPSWVSTTFEWNVFRYWGKISFSVYLLHTFIILNPTLNQQPNLFDRLVSRFVLIQLLAMTTYYLVEYPSQLMAQRISRTLAALEKEGELPRFTCMERINAKK
ncbi:hypothetical protein PRIC2_001946 [Phytophthora ramorum]